MPTVVLALLTFATVVALCRIFPDWAYLRPMLAMAIGMHAIAFVLRAARTPLWVAMPVLVLALLLLLSIIYYRDTLTFGLPTGRTIELLRLDLRLVLDQFATAVAPVPSSGSFATSTAVVVGMCVVLADTFAFRAMGRVEAVVPTTVLFVFTSALGADRHRIGVSVLWIAAALLTIAALRFSDAAEEGGWMGGRRVSWLAALPAVAVVIGVGAVAAAAVGPRLPGAGEQALIDTRNRQSSVTEVLSPLVDIRSRMKNRGNSELFTVQSSGGGHYWRVVSLPEFDGNTWAPPEEDLAKVGDRAGEVLQPGELVTTIFNVKALGGPLVPAPYQPVRVSPTSVLWAGESQSLVLRKGMQRGDGFTITSVITAPSPELLRSATVSGADQIYYSLPGGLPDAAFSEARRVTEGLSTPYDRAVALQQYFRQNFTYNLNVQLGNSNDAMDAFLRGREGFCQQFAGTFAVMARSIGLPARVAVGYTPGDLGADGVYHVFGRHAHAWPEVWFDGIGWVAFEPTPSRGNPDASQYTGVAAQQDDSGGSNSSGGNNNPTPSTTPVSVVRDPNSSTTVPGAGRPVGNGTTTTAAPATAGGNSGSGWVPLALFVLVIGGVLWVLLAPRAIAALARRRANTPRDRVIVAWHRACAALTLAGAPPVGGATPLEFAQRAEEAVGVSHHSIRELAVQVTRAVYSSAGFGEATAARCETLVDEIDARCRTITPWPLRLKALVDPRLMRQRIEG
jgi:transglutaminase-like putative cysteine protease